MTTHARRRLLGALIPLLLLLAGVSSTAADPGGQVGPIGSIDADTDPAVTEAAERWREGLGVPGAAVVVLDGGRVSTWLGGADGDGQPITSQTPFLSGSVAKTWTSALVLGLVEDGELDLDAPVGEAMTSPPQGLPAQVTVRDLLGHTSGYTAADGLAVSERGDLGPGAVGRAVDDLTHSGRPGAEEYSSANYLVLGALLEQRTGEPFAGYAERELFAPLGLDGTSAASTGEPSAAPPSGHRLWWAWWRPYAEVPDASGAPYGYVVTTPEDLATYARALLDGEVLGPETWREATTPHRGDAASGYGLGWSLTSGPGGRPLVHHTGATPGSFAHLVLDPERDRAVVVLANGYSELRAPAFTSLGPELTRVLDDPGAVDVGSSSGGGVLAAVPWVLASAAGVVGVLALARVVRLVVVGTRARRHPVPAVLAGLAAAAGAAVLVTGALMPWRTLIIWAPDVAVGSVALVLACAGLSLALLVRRRAARVGPGGTMGA